MIPSGQELLERVMLLIPVLLSLTVHEFAHAWSAYRLGDDTAARMGRLSLSPISHIDPIGTLLLPLLGIPFGWAKPVPVNPAGFRRNISMGTGMMLTAAAGPLSNLLLSVVCAVCYGLLLRWVPGWAGQHPGAPALLEMGMEVNVALAVFNALPIPPLDGSRILDGLMPYRFRDAWHSLQRFAPLALFALILYGGSWISGPTRFVGQLLGSLVARLVS